jgi:hypothetical protein
MLVHQWQGGSGLLEDESTAAPQVALRCRADVRLGTGRIRASELNGCSAVSTICPPRLSMSSSLPPGHTS